MNGGSTPNHSPRQFVFGALALLVFAGGYALGRFWPGQVQAPVSEAAATPEDQASPAAISAKPRRNDAGRGQVALAELVGMADRVARGQEPSLREYALLHQKIDAGQLAQWARELRERLPPARSEQLIEMLIEKLAEREPARAWDLAVDLENEDCLKVIIKRWGAEDPREMLRRYQGWETESPIRGRMAYYVFASLAQHDPELVWQELTPKPNEGWDWACLRQALGNIARENPARAEMLVDGVRSRKKRNEMREAIAGGLAVDNLPAALRYCETIENPKTRREAQLMALTRADADPATKARALKEMNLVASAKRHFIEEIMNQWLVEDWDAAVRWSNSLPEQQQAAGKKAMVSRAMKEDWRQGLRLLVAEHEVIGVTQMIISDLWSDLPEAERPELLGYLQSRVPREKADKYLEPILSSWARDDGPEALAYARQLAADRPDEGAPIFSSVLHGWASKSPAAAVRHLDVLVEEKRGRFLQHALRTWGREDPQAAAEWLQAYKPGPARDDGLESFATAIQRFDPAASLEWAGEIQDPERARNTQRYLFEDWQRQSPSQAKAWLDQSALPTNWKREFLED